MTPVSKQNNTSPPQGVHILIPGPYNYITLHCKEDLAGVIKLRVFRLRNYPELSREAQCNHQSPY